MFRLSSILRIAPALAALTIIAGVAFTTSCGQGLYPETSSSTTPTATPTQAAGGAYLYVTNYNDGTISEFSRNLTTGALKLIRTVGAGSKSGPRESRSTHRTSTSTRPTSRMRPCFNSRSTARPAT